MIIIIIYFLKKDIQFFHIGCSHIVTSSLIQLYSMQCNIPFSFIFDTTADTINTNTDTACNNNA